MESDNNNNMIDARPALPVSQESFWDKAAEKRDEIAYNLAESFSRQNVTAWIRKSKPGEYPVYVVVDAWKKIDESDVSVTIDKASLKIIILVEPYRIHPLVYHVEFKGYGKKFTVYRWGLSATEIDELVCYLINSGKTPKIFKSVSVIKKTIGVVIPFIGTHPKNKLQPEARPSYWYSITQSFLRWFGILYVLIFLLFFHADIFFLILSILLFDFSSIYVYHLTFFIFVTPGIFSIIIAIIMSKRIGYLETIPKQSERTPRQEFSVDSWHVSVPEGGVQFEQFRERVYQAVQSKSQNISIHTELHQFMTPYGYEERERLVLSRGQATLHIHVYPYANDTFVGWESYLNWSRWVPSKPVSTTIKSGKKVTYYSLDVGTYIPSDFDLIEVAVLAETTHRALIDEIKLFLKEREIEADLDFTIIRGDRANALKEGKEEKKKK